MQSRQLCALGRPARYGQGEQTLLDSAVRNTWEIPKSRVKIDKRRWNKTLAPVLERLGGDLGLPEGCKLEAQLHSMLVYAPGQFFVRHQDSEKEDAMVGSLVVTLPSTFTGGALEVEHRGDVSIYRGSKKALSCVAFYSDCRHQIKPVRSGHRVVLTYNLMLHGDQAVVLPRGGDPKLIDEVARCLDRHFNEPAPPRRLIYLLDHEYTARGLSWSCLKGADAVRVSMLRGAAEQASCEAVLALIDVHETWNAFEPEWHPWYGRSRYSRWGDEDDDSGVDAVDQEVASDYQLDELIDSNVTLDSWLGSPGGKVVEVGLSIGEDELSASTPTGDLSPYASEYEGYMGNWGNTLDRWYHRGALVVWPTSQDFSVRAEASPSWALDFLAAVVRKGDVATARHEATTLATFWNKATARVDSKGFFTKVMRTARLLEEPSTAALLLQPFSKERLAPNHAKAMSGLIEVYGEQWAADLIETWSTRRRWYRPGATDTEVWIASLPRLCVALAESGDPGRTAAILLLHDSWKWLRKAIERTLDLPSPSQRRKDLAELGHPVAAVLEGASVFGAADFGDEAAGFLCQDPDDLVSCGIEVLRVARKPGSSAVGLDAIADHCRRALEGRLARPLRPADDWSIKLPDGCTCDLCGTLTNFLSDRARKVFEWPIAKDRRAHVHARIDRAELPVSHETRRKGSPYTLVLTKTHALFEQEKQTRLSDEADLKWLRVKGGPHSKRR
jgi:hypothetical protein